MWDLLAAVKAGCPGDIVFEWGVLRGRWSIVHDEGWLLILGWDLYPSFIPVINFLNHSIH